MPKKKSTKVEALMAATTEASAKQYQGLELLLQQLLDKVTGLESWRTSADASLGTLLKTASDTAGRVQQLEAWPPPPPPPPPPQPSDALLHPHLQPGLGALDLNTAPSSRPSSSTSSREPMGAGILGPPPQQPPLDMAGITPEPTLVSAEFALGQHHYGGRSGPVLKMDFPKFSGDNPRLWKDRCEVYFKVYSVSEALKPRFASLNFEGAAATWLQSVQLRGRFQTWSAMATAVCAHFDRNQYPMSMKQIDTLK